MREQKVILNTYIESLFEVYNGSEWLRFMVSGNRRYHKDISLDFWLVTDSKTKKEHKLFFNKAQDLLNKNLLRYV